MLKFLLQMELSTVQRLRYSAHVVSSLMDQISLLAQRPDNGVAQFQIALKMRPQRFAYRHPLCQQLLSLEVDHRSHRERLQLPCERAAALQPPQQRLKNQFQSFHQFQLIWIQKKIKMTVTYFPAQFVRNIQGDDQLSQYQRITIIRQHLHQHPQQPQHVELKQQRKIFRKKLMPHIQVTMRSQEHTIMCK